MNAPAVQITEQRPGAAFAFKELRVRSIVVIALAIHPLLVALLLSGAARIAAVGGILSVVGLLFDVYRFEVDSVRQKITIRTLWLGWRQRGVLTYDFFDVLCLEKVWFSYGPNGCRWRFRDGATYEFLAPIDERLYELFGEKDDAFAGDQTHGGR